MRNFEFAPKGEQEGVVRAFLHSNRGDVKNRMRPAIIICPGGGYEWLSEREAEPVAKLYFAAARFLLL